MNDLDCHEKPRRECLPSIQDEDLTCRSIAWDWMFKGVTSAGINREVSSIIECARLNQSEEVQSLAIPETALLFLALKHLTLHKSGDQTSITILRGILPTLEFVVYRHQIPENICKMRSKDGTLLIERKPNACQNLGRLYAFEPSCFFDMSI